MLPERLARLGRDRPDDADLIGGVNLDGKERYLAQTLLDLSQTATINDSLKVGRAVLSEGRIAAERPGRALRGAGCRKSSGAM